MTELSKSLEARYQLLSTLGHGAAGVVYRVLDRETGETLALKKLLRMDLKSVTRLKQEFRALADLHHPNLIKLYDLGHTEDAWFITMEYLDGANLIRHLADDAQQSIVVAKEMAAPELPHLRQVCGVFVQLARGLRALHRAGKLHRDLKPSNVIVAHGRVVILDFGLVREVGDHAATVTHEEALAGTPAYMAPEQVSNSALTEACDWYAFGVMLYEALSGELPFTGAVYQMLRRKLDQDAPSISTLVPALPAELAQLCTALLSRDPQRRPGYDAIVRTLAAFEPAAELTSQHDSFFDQLPPVRSAAPTLIGRERERAQLTAAFVEVADEGMVTVHVHGTAGSGKTAFVEHVLDGLAQGSLRSASWLDEPLILRARCYEREAMPFKALDGLLDGLVDYLARFDDVVVSHMLPTDVGELARAFPVLGRLPALKALLIASRRRDPVRERTRAEQVLRELLKNVCAHRPLVLWIDDLQWGDLDSVSVLKSWLEYEEPPALLLVLSYRSDERETNACLRLFAERREPQRRREISIELPPLTAAELSLLCTETLGDQAALQGALIERIVAESQGSPFLARQLLTLAQAQLTRGVANSNALTISGWLSQLTALLSVEERALLDLLAVAGRPLNPALALAAANILRAGSSQLHTLNSMNLTRMRVVNEQRCIEIYHHRMGEALLAGLPTSERVAIYRRLLNVLELSGSADPDWLHLVAVGAEDNPASIRYGRLAAERAVASLAFERAADLFRDCIARADADAELWRKLGAALDACGQGIRAAEAYVEAAARAPADEELELLRLAATHLVRSGYFERGEELVQRVLSEMKIKLPSSESGLLAAIAWERGRLALRGLKFSWQSAANIDPQRHRIALMYSSLSFDTQSYDPLSAALFAARALRYSLDLGSPQLVCISMCTMASMHSVVGSKRDTASAADLLSRAQALAEELKQPLLLCRVYTTRAVCSFLAGRAAEAIEQSNDSQRYYALTTGDEEPGEYYLRSTLRATRIGALLQLSRFRDARNELHDAVQDARRTGSRIALLHLSLVMTLDDIAQDRAGLSRERLDQARAQLPQRRFGALHLMHLVAVMRAACALGDYAWARDTVDEMWPRFERSLSRHSVFAVLAYGAHARYLLNQYLLEARGRDPEALLRADLRALRNFSDRVGPAMHTRFRARLAHVTGQRELARELFRQHATECQLERFSDELERASWALGRVLGGSEGAELCARSISKLRERGVVNPEAEIGTHFPELIVSSA